ncbi:MAG: hypothetical protein ACQR33_04615 [Candidatus Saccharibacteria bacterium]
MTEENHLPIVESDSAVGNRAAIYQKLDGAWGSNVGDQGYADPYEVAERTFDAIYEPDAVDARKRAADPGVDEAHLPSHQLRDKTRDLLAAPLTLQRDAPDRQQFVATVAEAILQKANVGSAVLPGAREQIAELTDNGDKPAIWSAGYPEHQHRKLGKTGLHDSLLIAAIDPPVEISQEHGAPIELQTAIATDKTTRETFDRVHEIAGNNQVVVVDDRVRNLRAFMENVPETRAAIWVQYGAHAQKEMDKLARGENPQLATAIAEGNIIPIADISMLADKIESLRDTGILSDDVAAIFFDYDDTLSNNANRRKLELEAAVDAMFESELV